ncbi:hypothetical protein CUJ87_25960 [Paraburkholderia caledonica]|nr:hypothetical protein CUJ87_25960 [Paraburkholderia caledonica]
MLSEPLVDLPDAWEEISKSTANVARVTISGGKPSCRACGPEANRRLQIKTVIARRSLHY